jgi:hypothetical protein
MEIVKSCQTEATEKIMEMPLPPVKTPDFQKGRYNGV